MERIILRALDDGNYSILQDQNGLILCYVKSDRGEIVLEDLIKVLSRPYISIVHKICVLNPDETVDYEIPESDIIENSINYSENINNGQRRSLSFKLINKDGKYNPCVNYDYTPGQNQINRYGIQTPLWGGVRFLYEVGVKVRDDEYYWFPKGVYVLSKVGVSGPDDEELSITLSDKFSIFEGNHGKFLYSTEIKYGNDVNLVVKDILHQDTGLGTMFDYKKPMISSEFKDFKTQSSIRKEEGDTYASVFEELFTQMNASYFYNEIGNFVVIPLQEEMRDETKMVLWKYLEEKGDLIDLQKDYDLDNAVNIIYVEGNNVDIKTYSALVVNNDPRSPFAVSYLGKRFGDKVNDCNIWSSSQARDLGVFKLRKNTLECLSMSAQVRFNPLLTIDGLIIIENNYFNLKGDKFIIKEISFSSGNAEMNLKIVDIQTLSFIKVGDGNAIGLFE